jgi:hypothetical protein
MTDFHGLAKMKKPDIRFAHFQALFFLSHLKASFQSFGKIKPGTFVPGFFICRGEKIII